MNYPELLVKILAKGNKISPRGQEIKELNHVQLEVTNNIFTFQGVRDLNFILNYYWCELAWYMSGDRRAEYIALCAKLWEKIKNPDGTLNSNYGYLIFYHRTHHPSVVGPQALYPSVKVETMTPFDWAVHSLKNDKDSRQAVITYNNGGYNFEGNKDYICTQHQAFYIRQEKLNCYVALRSSDAIFGLTYNMPWWSIVQQQLRLALLPTYPNLQLGDIIVTIYSAHIYQQHYELVEKMLKTQIDRYHLELTSLIPLGKTLDWYVSNIEHFLTIKNVAQDFDLSYNAPKKEGE